MALVICQCILQRLAAREPIVNGVCETLGVPEGITNPLRQISVLDKILVDAAVEAGAELREEFTTEEVLLEDGLLLASAAGPETAVA